MAAGVLASAPAQAAPAGDFYDSWVTREDAPVAGDSVTRSWSGAGANLRLGEYEDQLDVYRDSSEGSGINASFLPPAGQSLRAGATYRAEGWPAEPTTKAGRLLVWRDGTMCGKTREELFAGYWPANPVTGTFHVTELARDTRGALTRFAATYELNCQVVGGQPGLEGSIAVNATDPPAPVPDAPATPAAVTALAATNVGPDSGGVNTTTLTWSNPPGYGDVNVERVQSSDRTKLPAFIGAYDAQQYLGRASRYSDPWVDFMDTRTYRVVPRGPSGRLGPATLLLVMGTRLSIPEPTQKVSIGQQVELSGRLSESWDYVKFSDVMKGPGLVGRSVVLCRQSSTHFVDSACTPVDRTRTAEDGHFTLSVTPRENSLYTVVVPATPQMLGNASRVITALVSPQTDLSAPEAERDNARTLVRRGSVIHFSTSRARAGARGVVLLQRQTGKSWRTVLTRRIDARGSRRIAVPYRERTRGLHAYRVVKPGDAKHVNGYSRTVHVRVG